MGHRKYRAVLLAVGFASLLALGMQAGRKLHHQLSAQTAPEDTILPAPLYPSALVIPEKYEIQMARVIARAVVTDISPSCWNTLDCTYSAPDEVWSGDTLISSHTPGRYFTVTLAFTETWHNEIGVESPLTVTDFGRSPTDPQPLEYEPFELVRSPDSMVDWVLGNEMIVMLQPDEWVIEGVTRTIMSAPYGAQYHVQPDGYLTNPLSGSTSRSSTVSALYDHVIALLYP